MQSTAGRSHNVGHFGYSPKLSVVNRSIPARQRQQQILSCCQSHAAAANGDTSNHRKQSKHDAIVVLGGGLTAEGGIPGWGQQRLKKALQIYKQPGLCIRSAWTIYAQVVHNLATTARFHSKI